MLGTGVLYFITYNLCLVAICLSEMNVVFTKKHNERPYIS